MLIRLLLALGLILAPATAGSRGTDGKFSERKSSHFRLLQDVNIERYSGPKGSREFERDVLVVLENAYRQVGDAIGIRPRTDFAVVIYDPGVFDQNFASRFGFRAAGFFDGVIHVRGATLVDRPLSYLGLHGRSFVPMLSGFACAIPAVFASRSIPTQRERLLTIWIIPTPGVGARGTNTVRSPLVCSSMMNTSIRVSEATVMSAG